jgi:hypothetical protein
MAGGCFHDTGDIGMFCVPLTPFDLSSASFGWRSSFDSIMIDGKQYCKSDREKVKLSSSFKVFQQYLYGREKERLQKRGWNSNSSKLIRDPPASYEVKDFQLQAHVRPVL